MTKCPKCGAENPDHILYCGFCTAPLREFSGGPPQTQYWAESPVRSQRLINDQTRLPLTILVIGVILAVVGVILYAAAWSAAFNEIGEFSNDPFNTDFSGFGVSVALVFAAYALWILGGILFIVGLILLVIRSM